MIEKTNERVQPMAITTAEILDVMREHGVVPDHPPPELDLPTGDGPALPGIGQVEEGEAVYATSIDEVFGDGDDGTESGAAPEDPRIREWWEDVRPNVESPKQATARRLGRRPEGRRSEPPEPHCAWYSPIHFFAHGWGIYIRERCVLEVAADVALFVDRGRVHLSSMEMARQLLHSAFNAYFLHEQFHHKVESLGLRLMVSTDSDRYRPHKAKVYRPTFMTVACLEESLANAESLRRLDEPRYVQRIDPAIRLGLRKFLRAAIALQPPGYREGLNFVREEDSRAGLFKLQLQILDASLTPRTPDPSWSVAPNMITALADTSDSIYVVLPKGARPIVTPTWVDTGATVSTRNLVEALTKHYGYEKVAGGNGSHVKLKKPGAQTITLAGSQTNGSVAVAKRAGVEKSVLSKCLNEAPARISLPTLLSIAASEGFSVAGLIRGDLTRAPLPKGVGPDRTPRRLPRHDHGRIDRQMRLALEAGETISKVAEQVAASTSTLARHEALYSQLRDDHQARVQQERSRVQVKARHEAERVAVELLGLGVRPTLRRAGELTNSK